MSDKSTIIEKFLALAREAERIDMEEFEQPLDPSFDAVLNFVLAHPEAQEEFTKIFIKMLSEWETLSPCLVEYCMHVLKWEKIRKAVLEWLEQGKNERRRHIYMSVLDAFDDNWRSASMYDRFS